MFNALHLVHTVKKKNAVTEIDIPDNHMQWAEELGVGEAWRQATALAWLKM